MAKVNYIELNNTLKPINKNTVKAIERNSAKFIYVNRDRVAKCECCNSEFTLANAKHHSIEKCPKCHRSLEVIHTWRKSKNESIYWEIVGSAVTDTTFAIRYYLVTRMNGEITDSTERARMFINTDKKEVCRFENSIWTNTWSKSGYSYFREFGMSYARNRFFCMDGVVRRQTILKELKKMSALKYTDIESIWTEKHYAHALAFILPRVSLYEKLQKIGLQSLINADMDSYRDNIEFNGRKTELTKMLGINKNGINMLKTCQTLNALKVIQHYPTINEVEFNAFKDYTVGDLESVKKSAEKIGCTLTKVANYITKQKASTWEYSRYIEKLEQLNYNVKDHSYAFPKNMVNEMKRLELEEKRTRMDKNNVLIKAVRDELYKNKALQEFFKGAKGFMAYVPMSEEEFIEEGKAQHNCVGKMGYADRMADGKTLIFFVREIDKPDASFVTMEYRNGRIIQCMLDHNERVKEDTKVYDFCSALADRLNKCNILAA